MSEDRHIHDAYSQGVTKTSDDSRVPCPECGQKFKSRGLKIHTTRRHAQQANATSTASSNTGQSQHVTSQPSASQVQPRSTMEEFGIKLAQMKATIPTLRRVPKGARMQTAQTLSSVLNELVSKNDELSWRKLFTFPFATLEVPRKCDNVKNLTKWVKEKVERWTRDPCEPQHRPRSVTQAKRENDGGNVLTKKIEAKLSDGDVKGAVRLATSDDTVAPMSADTLLALKAKHPAHQTPLLLPSPPITPTCPPVSEKEVSEAISSFNPGSAGGLDGLRPQILKDLTSKPLGMTAEQLIRSIQQFVDLLLSGKVPDTISPLLFGASLTALQKKDGGIRPVAVGMTLRRLASKIVVSRITPVVTKLVSPHQLGVGVKGGAEGGAHTARRYWNHPHSSPKLFLKLDFRNAFNELRRDSMLQAVQSHIPTYFSYINSCYGRPSLLYYGPDSILSQRGIQQGDPLGPALFTITVHPIVDTITTELNVWYLDDATVSDSVDLVLETFSNVREMSDHFGLHLNVNKCEASILGATPAEEEIILSRLREEVPEIRIFGEAGATLLGAPLSDTAIDLVLGQKTDALLSMSKRLKLLTSHSAFFLLRASVSIPRLIYFLRCAPTWRCLASLLRYDSTLKEAIEGILNCALSEESWKQSSLPVKSGGLGIRHAADSAIPCLLASAHGVQHLVSQLLPAYLQADSAVEEGMFLWNSNNNYELPALNERYKQDAWEKPQIEETVRFLYDSASTQQDKARLLAIQQPDSGSWLFAVPSPQLGTHLSDETFRVCCSIRLGCDVCQPHTCPCGVLVNSKGYHGLSCKISSGRRSRHERANDIISRALRTAEVPNVREPAGCSRSDGKRPDGLTLVPWSQGRSLVWDFTCADTVAPSYLDDTEKVPGSAAEKAEKKKKCKYGFLSARYIFVPVAIETFGVWGAEGKTFIQEIATRLVKVTGDVRVASFLKQRISLAIQQGNVASILGTLPPGKTLDEIFLF